MNRPAPMPRPVTSTDVLLYAILDELTRVREALERMSPQPPEPAGVEVLREARPKKAA